MKNINSKTRSNFKAIVKFSLFKRAAAIFIFALAIFIFSPETVSAQSHCGRAGQRPCRIWERIPSCNKGTVENFAKDRCVAKTPCGGLNQRACNVWENLRACKSGLAKYGGRCVSLDPDNEKTVVRFCNYSGYSSIYAAIGQLVQKRGYNGYYISHGWYEIINGTCQNFSLGNGYKGYAYAYAIAEDNAVAWGGSFNFYVNWYDGFDIRQDEPYLESERDFREVGMFRVAVKPGVVTTQHFR